MSLKSLIFKVLMPSLLLFGCGVMPASGPQGRVSSGSIVNINNDGTYKSSSGYAVVEFSPSVLEYISNRNVDASGVAWPKTNSPEIIKVSVGDTIQVTIYEAQSGGLFVPKEAGVRPGNFISLPPQTVEKSGYITIPYVGLVKVSGRTTVDISKSIASSLSERAIEPQVVVTFNDRSGSEVSVIGAVEGATRFSLNFAGDRILDAIASAGGLSSPGYETWVSLIRGDEEYQIPFDDIVLNPKRNVYIRSDDTIYLYREPKQFIAYGAVENQGNIAFGKRELFLSEALGLASGLDDSRADPAEIYIYRHEQSEFLNDLTFAVLGEKDKVSIEKDTVPVIYKLDLRDPNGFFWAQKFQMQNDDVIYVANSKSVEFLKFINILNSTTSAARDLKATKDDY